MSRRSQLDRLRNSAPAVLPSLLLCDFGNLEREVAALVEAGVEGLHLDVMDGQFVPNLTYGMPIVAGLRKLTDMPLDVHLMIESPGRFLSEFRDAGADVLTIHVETADEPDQVSQVLEQIRERGMAAGAAINPSTPWQRLEPCLDHCDLALVMSVEAGFGGQSFDSQALERARQVRQRSPDVVLEMDGGINTDTISSAAEAGAELLVVGSAIFRKDCYSAAVAELSAAAAQGAGARK